MSTRISQYKRPLRTNLGTGYKIVLTPSYPNSRPVLKQAAFPLSSLPRTHDGNALPS
jgi:hypothetical protein